MAKDTPQREATETPAAPSTVPAGVLDDAPKPTGPSVRSTVPLQHEENPSMLGGLLDKNKPTLDASDFASLCNRIVLGSGAHPKPEHIQEVRVHQRGFEVHYKAGRMICYRSPSV